MTILPFHSHEHHILLRRELFLCSSAIGAAQTPPRHAPLPSPSGPQPAAAARGSQPREARRRAMPPPKLCSVHVASQQGSIHEPASIRELIELNQEQTGRVPRSCS